MIEEDTFDPKQFNGKTIKDYHEFSGDYVISGILVFDDDTCQKVLFNRLDDDDAREFYELFLTLWDKATAAPGYVKKPWGMLNDLLINIGMGPRKQK